MPKNSFFVYWNQNICVTKSGSWMYFFIYNSRSASVQCENPDPLIWCRSFACSVYLHIEYYTVHSSAQALHLGKICCSVYSVVYHIKIAQVFCAQPPYHTNWHTVLHNPDFKLGPWTYSWFNNIQIDILHNTDFKLGPWTYSW